MCLIFQGFSFDSVESASIELRVVPDRRQSIIVLANERTRVCPR
jgi:hypothetical protein